MFKEAQKFHLIISNEYEYPPSLARLNSRYNCFFHPIKHKFKSAKVLDIGCHNGGWIYASYCSGATLVVGIENKEKYVNLARLNLNNCDVLEDVTPIIHGDCLEEMLKYPAGYFDIILCLGVLYFLDCKKFFHQCYRLQPKLLILNTFTFGPNKGTVESQSVLEQMIIDCGFKFRKFECDLDARLAYWCYNTHIKVL